VKQFIIFSVFRSEDHNDINLSNTLKVLETLKSESIEYRMIDGAYKGETEVSIMVDARHENRAIEIANIFNQESILFVDKLKRSFLVYLDTGKTVRLKGKFQEISIDTAHKIDAFSRCPYSNKYYGVV